MATFQRLCALVCVGCCLTCVWASDKKAKTEDGREVILRDDGTWVFADAAKPAVKPGGEFTKDKRAVSQYKGKRDAFELFLVPDVWTQAEKPANPSAEVQFRHTEGDLFAMVIAERIAVTPDALKKIAIAGWKKSDPDVKVVLDEKRKVNGREMTCLRSELTTNGIDFVFYGYYFTGEEGTYQVLTWTGKNLFKDYKADMEAFMNGFVLAKKPAKDGK